MQLIIAPVQIRICGTVPANLAGNKIVEIAKLQLCFTVVT